METLVYLIFKHTREVLNTRHGREPETTLVASGNNVARNRQRRESNVGESGDA